MSVRSTVEKALGQGKGVLRLAPTWVPRFFCVPGRRIKLHPCRLLRVRRRPGRDRRAVVLVHHSRGQRAEDQPGRGPEPRRGRGRVPRGEGHPPRRHRGAQGQESSASASGTRTRRWPMYSKFFDNKGALPHHVHHRDQHAKLVGRWASRSRTISRSRTTTTARTFLTPSSGCKPGTTKDQLRECLLNFTKGDNRITDLSTAYRLEPGTGWDVPAGILHAPGSLCTYEPQKASDVFAMYQSLTGDAIIPEELLWKNSPKEKVGNVDYLIELLDWEANVDPDFAAHHFMRPRACPAGGADGGGGLRGELDHLQVPGVQRQGAHRAPRARPSPSRTAAHTA